MTRLRTLELYRDDQYRLIAIASVELSLHKFGAGAQCYGCITPLVVIVCTPDGAHVLDVDDTSLDNLKRAYPELDNLINLACRKKTHA